MYILLYLFLHSVASKLNCTRLNSDSEFQVGDRLPVCLYFSNNPDETMPHRMFFEPKVDEYSGIEASGVYEKYLKQNERFLKQNERFLNQNDTSLDLNDTSLDLNDTSLNQNDTSLDENETSLNQNEIIYLRIGAADGEITDPVPYLNSTDELVGVVYSAVVTLKDGEVDKVEWDNDCGACDDCLEYEDEEVCAEDLCDTNSFKDCDPKVYISWMGTDKNGIQLVSAGYRISQFRKFSLYEVYNESKTSF